MSRFYLSFAISVVIWALMVFAIIQIVENYNGKETNAARHRPHQPTQVDGHGQSAAGKR